MKRKKGEKRHNVDVEKMKTILRKSVMKLYGNTFDNLEEIDKTNVNHCN